jgi:hypothetical protein
MKVLLFCGGLGLRLRDHTERVPKPMVPIGYRPIRADRGLTSCAGTRWRRSWPSSRPTPSVQRLAKR